MRFDLKIFLIALSLGVHLTGRTEEVTEPAANETARQKWEQLTPEQRDTARRNFQTWKKLTPEQRARVRENFRHRKNLHPPHRIQRREWRERRHLHPRRR